MSSRSLRKQGAYDTRCNVHAERRDESSSIPRSAQPTKSPLLNLKEPRGKVNAPRPRLNTVIYYAPSTNFPSLRTFKIANVDNLLAAILYSAGFQSRDKLLTGMYLFTLYQQIRMSAALLINTQPAPFSPLFIHPQIMLPLLHPVTFPLNRTCFTSNTFRNTSQSMVFWNQGNTENIPQIKL